MNSEAAVAVVVRKAAVGTAVAAVVAVASLVSGKTCCSAELVQMLHAFAASALAVGIQNAHYAVAGEARTAGDSPVCGPPAPGKAAR